MNMNQFTQKSLAAIQGAQDIALEYGHQQIEQAHLLMALVQDGEGLIPQLLTNMGLTLPSFQAAVQHEEMCIRDRRRMASDTRRTASSWPTTRWWRMSSR